MAKYTQADVNKIVARAKEIGASDGMVHKQGQFDLGMYGNDAEALAMLIINAWHDKYDLIWATQALIEFLEKHEHN